MKAHVLSSDKRSKWQHSKVNTSQHGLPAPSSFSPSRTHAYTCRILQPRPKTKLHTAYQNGWFWYWWHWRGAELFITITYWDFFPFRRIITIWVSRSLLPPPFALTPLLMYIDTQPIWYWLFHWYREWEREALTSEQRYNQCVARRNKL